MNNIIGIGLPRTGTASLSQALIRLGKSSQHYCILNDSHKMSAASNPDTALSSAFVDNSYYRIYKSVLFDDKFENTLFILTTRNLIDWQKSMSKFKVVDNIPNVNDYEKDIKRVFKQAGKEKQLLIINIFDDPNSFKLVADFIGIEHDNTTFPHVNKEKLELQQGDGI